jgi:hypothetical protein
MRVSEENTAFQSDGVVGRTKLAPALLEAEATL